MQPYGSVTTYQYNGLNQLTEILNKTSTDEILNQHVFTYNTLDLRGSETISGAALPAIPSLPEETVDYDYNAANQLLSLTNPNLTVVYDDDGNMIQGYTLEGYVFTATYDAESQMTSLEYTDSSSVVHRTEYRYSGDGFLAIIRKFEGDSLVDEIRIVRDGLLAVQERDGSNNVLREYTWGLNLGGGIGGLLNLKQGGQDYAYLYDGKGNVAAVLDASQNVVAAYRYAPFGELLVKTGSLDQPFGFSTKRYDAQTGLIYYGYRFYGPEIGRWTTRDPLGEAGGMNLYVLVGNNPVNWGDPWGLDIVINDAGTPIMVSGNPGTGHGEGFQYFAVLPSNGQRYGGTDNPIAAYPSRTEALIGAGYYPALPFELPIGPSKKVYDIDFYDDPANPCLPDRSNTKLSGDDIGPVTTLMVDKHGKIKVKKNLLSIPGSYWRALWR